MKLMPEGITEAEITQILLDACKLHKPPQTVYVAYEKLMGHPSFGSVVFSCTQRAGSYECQFTANTVPCDIQGKAVYGLAHIKN